MQEEMQGMTSLQLGVMKDIFIPAAMVDFLKYVKAPAPGLRVSPIVAGAYLWTAGDGRILQIIAKMQFFYDEEGNITYLMGSVDTFYCVNISDDGVFTIDASEQQPSHHPSQQQLQPEPQPLNNHQDSGNCYNNHHNVYNNPNPNEYYNQNIDEVDVSWHEPWQQSSFQ